MKKIISISAALVAIVLLSGCGQSTPECDDSDVLSLVKDNIRESMKDNFIAEKTRGGFYSYEGIKESLEKGSMNDQMAERASKIVEEVDEQVDDIKFVTSDVKTISTHKKYFKATCQAVVEITFDGRTKKKRIKFTAKDTEDNGLEVDL